MNSESLTEQQIKGWKKHPANFKFEDEKFYTKCLGCGKQIEVYLNDFNDPEDGDASASCDNCTFNAEFDELGLVSYST